MSKPLPPPARVMMMGGSLLPNWLLRRLNRQEVGVMYAKPYKRGDKPLP